MLRVVRFCFVDVLLLRVLCGWRRMTARADGMYRSLGRRAGMKHSRGSMRRDAYFGVLASCFQMRRLCRTPK
ncbi:hypothetical protein BDY21DRAFT_343816 [Lineolata rhizophorae]|uniref:Secreted protein n=1 Tax=Lineolata rhizophorae TaxID=578093 RepID=A0A6A6P0E7_9PEZI|nr:hypothetical protein BDY21DRAFT_343816 [Lineolata rhizophorae]